jgi:hypothetical protein
VKVLPVEPCGTRTAHDAGGGHIQHMQKTGE